LTQRPEKKVRDAELTDEELLAQFLQGDQTAFRSLYHRYVLVLTRRMQRVFSRQADVDDAVQETFTQIYRIAERYEPGRSFSAWIHGIAFRVAGARIAKKKRKKWLVFGEAEHMAGPVTATHGLADDKAEEIILVRKMRTALAQLPEEMRTAFIMRELEDMDLREIAEIFGTSAQTIWARVESAKKRLRKLLEAQ